jgi:hypothetical protein
MDETDAENEPDVSLENLIERWLWRLGLFIGERNDRNPECYARLNLARDTIVDQLQVHGLSPTLLPYRAGDLTYYNIALELPGSRPDSPALVVGAHYDSARHAPGANDNASGIACLLAIARLLDPAALGCRVRLVAFANEEPPHTRKPSMGSLVYARALQADRIAVRGMLSLETLAPVRSRLITQAHAPLFVVGNLRSLPFARRLRDALSVAGRHSALIGAPGFLPGVRSSDHWSFWQLGWPAVMLTAGGPLTYWHYHRPSDRVEHVDFRGLPDLARACSNAITALTHQIGS